MNDLCYTVKIVMMMMIIVVVAIVVVLKKIWIVFVCGRIVA